MRVRVIPRFLLAAVCLAAASTSAAEALDELLGRLQTLTASTEVTAHITTQVRHQLGEEDEANIRQGEASVRVHQDSSGLRFYYTPELLAQMNSEQQQQTRDPDAQTPVLTAIDELQPVAVSRMLSAAENLMWLVESSQYEGSQAETLDGKPVRKLTFSFGLERLSQRDKKYVKKYQSEVHVWIDDTGTPVASHHFSRLSGSAFIIIRFKSTSDEHRRYHRHADRLLITHRTFSTEASGAGEYSAFDSEHQLSVIGL